MLSLGRGAPHRPACTPGLPSASVRHNVDLGRQLLARGGVFSACRNPAFPGTWGQVSGQGPQGVGREVLATACSPILAPKNLHHGSFFFKKFL